MQAEFPHNWDNCEDPLSKRATENNIGGSGDIT
jgi:hypothetical protein